MDVTTLPSGGYAGGMTTGGGRAGMPAEVNAGTTSDGNSTDAGGTGTTMPLGAGAGTSAGQDTGGSGNVGGAIEVGGSGGAGMRVPGPIDFAAWELQLPIGSGTSPTTISSIELLAGFSNDYFYLAEDGGQVFMDPAKGVTTSGSQHCRTEMREQTPGAGDAAWTSSGTNTMTVEGKVVKLGGGSVSVGQLFDASGSMPLCELQYTTSHTFSLFYEESKGNGSSIGLKTAVPLDARYAFTLSLSAGKLSVTINGKQVYTRTPSAAVANDTFYFKVGNYDQSTSAGTPTATPYSVVEAYKVDLVHE